MNKVRLFAAGLVATVAALSFQAQASTLNGEFGPVAREASEGPRGKDNERPGDRQRRGGRNGVTIDSSPAVDLLAREASEGPRGQDNERPGDRQRRGGRGGRG